MPQDSAKVLLIDDEEPIRRFVRISLESQQFRVAEAGTLAEGLKLATSDPPDVILLDLGLPDGDGLDFIRTIRGWSKTPVIVLSARGRESDKVAALDVGADDYLTKPFGVGELTARIRVALRHAQSSPSAGESVFQVGDLKVDYAKRQVFVDGEEVHLTPTEYRLLTVLSRNAGMVVTHRQLLKEVWGPGSVYENQYVRVFVGQLRQKIEDNPTRPKYIRTESGVGYRMLESST
jgi:two-component system KDP operon response regulator KdpE